MIAGLGNPGRSYARHRHNAGFMVLDLLGRRHGIEISRKSFGALVGSGAIGGEAVILAKPQTFMNLSGDSVAPLLRYYRLGKEDLIVVHDDLDIDVGKLKLSQGAGHGGHNGIRSIFENIGASDFSRVRVGIGRPPAGMDGASYVLHPFGEEEAGDVEDAMALAADSVEMLVAKGLAAAQQKYH
ncbi:MAG: aminoacyl-tRNA hydrolase [Pseudomonadota bacterium]